MLNYWSLLTGAGKHEVDTVERGLEEGTYHPAEAKRDLAEKLVCLYHSADAARGARAHFDRVFKEKDKPVDMPGAPLPAEAVVEGKVWLPRLLTLTGLASSNGEARRLIEQGGVKVDDVVITDPKAELEPDALRGAVVQVGKRKFLRLI